MAANGLSQSQLDDMMGTEDLRGRVEHVVSSQAKLGQNLWSVVKDFVYAHDLATAQPPISINCLSTFLQQIKLALKGHFSDPYPGPVPTPGVQVPLKQISHTAAPPATMRRSTMSLRLSCPGPAMQGMVAALVGYGPPATISGRLFG